MPVDRLQLGLARLTARNQSHRARTVTYVRAALSLSITATLARSEHQAPDAGLGVVEVTTRDYFILRDDLAAVFGDPQPGDQIHDTLHDEVRVFEVAGPAGKPCAEFTAGYELTWRIHTNDMGVLEP